MQDGRCCIYELPDLSFLPPISFGATTRVPDRYGDTSTMHCCSTMKPMRSGLYCIDANACRCYFSVGATIARLDELPSDAAPSTSHLLVFQSAAPGTAAVGKRRNHYSSDMASPQLAQVTGLSSYGRFMGYCWNGKLMVVADDEGNVRLWKLPRFNNPNSFDNTPVSITPSLLDMLSTPDATDASASTALEQSPPTDLLTPSPVATTTSSSEPPIDSLFSVAQSSSDASITLTLASSTNSTAPLTASLATLSESAASSLLVSTAAPAIVELWCKGKFGNGWPDQSSNIASVTASYILASAMVMVRGYSDGKVLLVACLSLSLLPHQLTNRYSCAKMSIHKIPSDPSPRFIRGHRGSRVNTLFCSVSHGMMMMDRLGRDPSASLQTTAVLMRDGAVGRLFACHSVGRRGLYDSCMAIRHRRGVAYMAPTFRRHH
jgi:hypothetical protein